MISFKILNEALYLLLRCKTMFRFDSPTGALIFLPDTTLKFISGVSHPLHFSFLKYFRIYDNTYVRWQHKHHLLSLFMHPCTVWFPLIPQSHVILFTSSSCDCSSWAPALCRSSPSLPSPSFPFWAARATRTAALPAAARRAGRRGEVSWSRGEEKRNRHRGGGGTECGRLMRGKIMVGTWLHASVPPQSRANNHCQCLLGWSCSSVLNSGSMGRNTPSVFRIKP